MDKTKIRKAIDAFRSGEYTQTFDHLVDKDVNGRLCYCAEGVIGVAVYDAIPETFTYTDSGTKLYRLRFPLGEGAGYAVHSLPHQIRWDMFGEIQGVWLVSWNDDYRWDFDIIANVLEMIYFNDAVEPADVSHLRFDD